MYIVVTDDYNFKMAKFTLHRCIKSKPEEQENRKIILIELTKKTYVTQGVLSTVKRSQQFILNSLSSLRPMTLYSDTMDEHKDG